MEPIFNLKSGGYVDLSMICAISGLEWQQFSPWGYSFDITLKFVKDKQRVFMQQPNFTQHRDMVQGVIDEARYNGGNYHDIYDAMEKLVKEKERAYKQYCNDCLDELIEAWKQYKTENT